MSNFVVHILNSVLYTVKAKLYLQKLSKLQWPRGSSAARLLGLRVRIPPEAWMSVSCECRVLSGGRADHSSRGVLPTVLRRCV